jgi:hypothetical protein
MADVLGAVVHLEPNWEAVPSDVPPLVRTLLQECLRKDRRERVADISAALFVLNRSGGLGNSADKEPVPQTRVSWRRMAIPVAVAAAAAGAVALWLGRPAGESATPRVSRLQITPTGPAALTVGGTDLAITPDGSRIVYVGNGSRLAAGQAPRTLVWVDRQGRETSNPAPSRG